MMFLIILGRSRSPVLWCPLRGPDPDVRTTSLDEETWEDDFHITIIREGRRQYHHITITRRVEERPSLHDHWMERKRSFGRRGDRWESEILDGGGHVIERKRSSNIDTGKRSRRFRGHIIISWMHFVSFLDHHYSFVQHNNSEWSRVDFHP